MQGTRLVRTCPPIVHHLGRTPRNQTKHAGNQRWRTFGGHVRTAADTCGQAWFQGTLLRWRTFGGHLADRCRQPDIWRTLVSLLDLPIIRNWKKVAMFPTPLHIFSNVASFFTPRPYVSVSFRTSIGTFFHLSLLDLRICCQSRSRFLSRTILRTLFLSLHDISLM